jgi:hypothetical protein
MTAEAQINGLDHPAASRNERSFGLALTGSAVRVVDFARADGGRHVNPLSTDAIEGCGAPGGT